MSGAASRPNTCISNNKAADPYQESAATFTAATGQPPETYSGARLQKFTYKGQAAVATPEGAHN